MLFALGLLLTVVLALAPAMAQDTGTLHVRVAHLAPDAPAVDIYVNGELSPVKKLAFRNASAWIELPAGKYSVAVVPNGKTLQDAVIGPKDYELKADQWLTIAAVGTVAKKNLKAVVISEDYSPIKDGDVRVTVFHGISDGPAVDVYAGKNKVITELAFPGKRGTNDGATTLNVPAGLYNLKVVAFGRSKPVILNLPSLGLNAGTNYLLAAIGTASAPEGILIATDESQASAAAAPTAEATAKP
jgi:hypothetical protein